MKINIRKSLSLLFAVLLLLGMMPINARANNVVQLTSNVSTNQALIQSAIDGSIPGGDSIIVNSSEEIHVTSGMTINIPSGIEVIWNAVYIGAPGEFLIRLTGSGSFTVEGGRIENTGSGNAIYAPSTVGSTGNAQITVSAGAVVANTGNAILTEGVDALVTVRDTGTVFNNAQNNLRPAINMLGMTGPNTYANPKTNVVIRGGTVASMSLDGSGYAIQTYGNVEVDEPARIFVTNGRAINLVGMNSTAFIEGGTVEAIGNGAAISTATTANLIPNVENAGVVVRGGTIRATTGVAIQTTGTNGTVTISGGQVYNISTGAAGNAAVHVTGQNSRVTISGGEVWSDNARAVNTTSTASNAVINVSGGVVRSKGAGNTIHTMGAVGEINISGNAVVAADEGYAINLTNTGAVNISGGQVYAMSRYAVNASNASFSMSGGFVFAFGTGTGSIGDVVRNTAFVNSGANSIGNGILVAWYNPSVTRYVEGRHNDLFIRPTDAESQVRWAGGGIDYSRSSNTGFLSIPYIVVYGYHGLLFDVSSGQFYMNVDRTYKIDDNPKYTYQVSNFHWDQVTRTLTLDGFGWYANFEADGGSGRAFVETDYYEKLLNYDDNIFIDGEDTEILDYYNKEQVERDNDRAEFVIEGVTEYYLSRVGEQYNENVDESAYELVETNNSGPSCYDECDITEKVSIEYFDIQMNSYDDMEKSYDIESIYDIIERANDDVQEAQIQVALYFLDSLNTRESLTIVLAPNSVNRFQSSFTAPFGEAPTVAGMYFERSIADVTIKGSGELVAIGGDLAPELEDGYSFGILLEGTNLTVKDSTIRASGGSADAFSGGIMCARVSLELDVYESIIILDGGEITGVGGQTFRADSHSYGIVATSGFEIIGSTVTAVGDTYGIAPNYPITVLPTSYAYWILDSTIIPNDFGVGSWYPFDDTVTPLTPDLYDYLVRVTTRPTAAIANQAVTGVAGVELKSENDSGFAVDITLFGLTVDMPLNNEFASGWFADLPIGVVITADGTVGSNTITLKFSGTALNEYRGIFDILIPSFVFSGRTEPIAVLANNNAFFSIAPSPYIPPPPPPVEVAPDRPFEVPHGEAGDGENGGPPQPPPPTAPPSTTPPGTPSPDTSHPPGTSPIPSPDPPPSRPPYDHPSDSGQGRPGSSPQTGVFRNVLLPSALISLGGFVIIAGLVKRRK